MGLPSLDKGERIKVVNAVSVGRRKVGPSGVTKYAGGVELSEAGPHVKGGLGAV